MILEFVYYSITLFPKRCDRSTVNYICPNNFLHDCSDSVRLDSDTDLGIKEYISDKFERQIPVDSKKYVVNKKSLNVRQVPFLPIVYRACDVATYSVELHNKYINKSSSRLE